ncbi:hypothetical protein [Corynebacterium sp. sy039]|uniref:hypothetical protein n=2 Tax=Corynebacterium TaxID=1716 RepID=UPI0011B433BB|nr:hypothetical protein [Corynebacterium sp. sy039]QDZ41871.1 hypothetical protein FQV43_00835 [Corynebacterium sp. sy039]
MQPEVYVPTHEGDKLIGTREHGAPVLNTDNENVEAVLNGDDWGTIVLIDGVNATRIADSKDQFGNSQGQPVELTSVRDYPDLKPGEVSFDEFGKPICKDGQTTGRTCGTQVLRTSNGLWYLGEVRPGDSGGVTFDPNTGEALGVTSMTVLGLVGRSQPADVAIEKAYGIPDGQVNERFQLPNSTEAHTPMRNFQDDTAAANEWLMNNDPQVKQLQEQISSVTEEIEKLIPLNAQNSIDEVTKIFAQ